MARLVSSSPTCGTSRTPGRAAPAVGRLVSASGALPVGCQCCQCETRSNRQLAHQDHEQDNNHLLGAGMEVRGLGWGGAGRQGGGDAVSGALQDGGGGEGVPCLQSPYSSADRWGHKRWILGPTQFFRAHQKPHNLGRKVYFCTTSALNDKRFFPLWKRKYCWHCLIRSSEGECHYCLVHKMSNIAHLQIHKRMRRKIGLTKHHHKATKYASSIHQTMQTQIAVFTVVVPLHLRGGALWCTFQWLVKENFCNWAQKQEKKTRVCAKHECTTAVTKVLKTDLNDVCCRKGSRLKTPLRQA